MTEPPAGDRPVVVCLSGALLTRPGTAERARPKVIARLAEEIASARGLRVVLVHGGGSFGARAVERFGLSRPPAAPTRLPERTRGAAVVGGELRRLHLLVLRAVAATGLPSWSLPPNGLAANEGGELDRLDSAPFAAALESGLVPVSMGDIVADRSWGHSVLRADTLAVELVRHLRARRAVFATDVTGLPDPDDPRGRTVVRKLTEAYVARCASAVTGSPRAAATVRVARAALAAAAAGADAGLISGLSDGALSRAIRGEAVYGSWADARA